ncbi:MAG: prepilin-type N-terminal cleavage/methylation domain-containing protein [Eubacteriaceae bacterium]
MFKNERGFTLVEIIVVLVVLAVLAAFVLPTMLGFTGHAEESLCDTERKEIVKYFELNARIHPELTIDEFIEENYGQMDSLCPAGGTYYAYSYFEDEETAVAVVYCSVHTTSADGRLYVLSRQIMDGFLDLVEGGASDEDLRAYLGMDVSQGINFSNDTFRAKIFEENGNTWNKLTDSIIDLAGSEHENDYIQPYITLDKQVVLYANPTNSLSATNKWATTLVFNHEEGIWYEKVANSDGKVENFSMTQMGPYQADPVTWDELKEQFKDSTLWTAVK